MTGGKEGTAVWFALMSERNCYVPFARIRCSHSLIDDETKNQNWLWDGNRKSYVRTLAKSIANFILDGTLVSTTSLHPPNIYKSPVVRCRSQAKLGTSAFRTL